MTTRRHIPIGSDVELDALIDSEAGGVGTAIWRGPFSFLYNDVGLNAGIAFYTPTVDDLLLDVWALVRTAWDGTTPKGDVGTAHGSNSGLFAAFDTIDMTRAMEVDLNGAGNVSQEGEPNSMTARQISTVSSLVPRLITAAYPLKFWVTQNGDAGATAPGASQGRADIYIATCTPSAT